MPGHSGDSLFVLESVHNEAGALVDFRFLYPASHDATGSSGIQTALAGKLLNADRPLERSSWLCDKCKTVVETGKVFTHEVSTATNLDATWLRYRVVKFNDGVAVSITEIGSNFSATTRNLAFDKAFTISSPFAIIAVDLSGIVSEMNPAADRMLWYDKDEVVGRKSLFIFHDPQEVAQRAAELSQEFRSQVDPGMEVFKMIAGLGLTADTEWTYIRKDGSRLDVQLIVSPLTDEAGNMFGISASPMNHLSENVSRSTSPISRTMMRSPGCQRARSFVDRLLVALVLSPYNQSSIALLMVDLEISSELMTP